MTAKQFLTRHVEGYLFKDLRTMKRIRLRKGQKIGGLGYPMVATILSGMELLGCLFSNVSFNMNDLSQGNGYFENYWNNYFSIKHPKYRNYQSAFRQLIRNGLSHNFLTKTGIGITRGQSSEHLQIFTDNGNHYLLIDVPTLFKDFESSYFEYAKPHAYSNLSVMVTMQARINELISQYEQQSNRILSSIQPKASQNLELFNTFIGNASTFPGTVMYYGSMRNGINNR